MANLSANISSDLPGKPTTAAVLPAKPLPMHLRPTRIQFLGFSLTSSPTMAAECFHAPQPSSVSIPKGAKHRRPAATLRTSARSSAFHTPPTTFSTHRSDPSVFPLRMPDCSGRPPNPSALPRVPQARQDASHISKAADNPRHRIVGMNLILQINEALVSHRDKRFKHLPHRHHAVSHRNLALFALEVRQVLHVNVKQPRACFADRLNHIRAGTSRMPDIDAAPDPRIHTLYRLQYIQRRMPQLIFRPVIVDGKADVVFLYEFLDSRQSFQRGVAGDNDTDICALAILELTPDVGIFVFQEIDGSSGVKPYGRRGIVRRRSHLLLRIRREMIFDVLRIQREHIELLHEADHLRTIEVTERVAGQAQTNGRCFGSGWAFLGKC